MEYLDQLDEYKAKFDDFLKRDIKGENETYFDKIEEMLNENGQRLIIEIHHLRQFLDMTHFQTQPAIWFHAWDIRLNEIIQSDFKDELSGLKVLLEVDDIRFHVGVTGHFGSFFLSPRYLLTKFKNCLVCVEGIITRVSNVLPKILQSMHYCEENKKFQHQNYRDETSLLGMPNIVRFPKTYRGTDNPLEVEYGFCAYKNTQKFILQEMPENAPPGQLPRSVECHVEDDLIDAYKPGDRVKVYGIFRALPIKKDVKNWNGVLKTVLTVVNITPSSSKKDEVSGNDIRKFRTITKMCRKRGIDIMDHLSKSIAPSIYGHDDIKKSILLQMVGGCEKRKGIHLRGDIHILMVGDPGTAKSQFLRFCLNMSKIAISTTGRASTGVGLTAAVIKDKETKENTLAAGAMVLGDKGVVCVDEFDKMTDRDRTAMHEVMEQQTVTIQKAGVHTTLNARCTILAAANPIYGSYNKNISVQKNVGLPDSLLSRFDLCFIVIDGHEESLDRRIANHVLKLHMHYEKGSNSYFIKRERILQSNAMKDEGEESDDDEGESEEVESKSSENKYSVGFLRKYISFAKKKNPVITDEAKDVISRFYNEMRIRSKECENTLPITPRTLESLVRLSTAHAKLRFSKKIQEEDVLAIYKLMCRVLFLKKGAKMQVERKGKGKKRNREEYENGSKGKNEKVYEDNEEEEEGEDEDEKYRTPPKKKKVKLSHDGNDGNDDDDKMEDEGEEKEMEKFFKEDKKDEDEIEEENRMRDDDEDMDREIDKNAEDARVRMIESVLNSEVIREGNTDAMDVLNKINMTIQKKTDLNELDQLIEDKSWLFFLDLEEKTIVDV